MYPAGMSRRTLACASLLAIFAAACSDGDAGSGPASAGAGGSATTSATASAGANSGVTSSSTTTSGGGGGGPNVSPGCVDGQGLAEGEHTFTLDGLSRRYILRLPNGYTNDKAWPLVLALHGNGGSVDYWDVTSGPRNIRGVLQDDAVLVIAEAIEGNWRDYAMPPETWPERVEMELAYFEEVLSQARTDLCLDEDAIFAMGFSGGGSFSGVLGCRRTDIRAIAVGGSVIYFDEASCIHTPAAWITIGALELTPEREAFRDFFRDRAGCEATAIPTDPAPCQAYDACVATTPVHYCQHPGDHVWPDFGSEAMWAFFEQFTLPAP